jgi:hypothetical protein
MVLDSSRDNKNMSNKLSDILNGAKKTAGKVGGSIGSFFAPTAQSPTLEDANKAGAININIPKFLSAIKSNETSIVRGDPYLSSQPSGKPGYGQAMGAYRVTEADFNRLKGRYLSPEVTAKDFQNSPALQDKYMTNRALAMAAQGYTPQQIADFHNKGTGVLQTASASNHKPGSANYQNPDYVNKFNINYNSK